MKAHRVKKSLDLLVGKQVESVLVRGHLIFVLSTDKSLFLIDITPGNRVDMFLSENEPDPISKDDLVYSI
jgi:hypothetical protein